MSKLARLKLNTLLVLIAIGFSQSADAFICYIFGTCGAFDSVEYTIIDIRDDMNTAPETRWRTDIVGKDNYAAFALGSKDKFALLWGNESSDKYGWSGVRRNFDYAALDWRFVDKCQTSALLRGSGRRATLLIEDIDETTWTYNVSPVKFAIAGSALKPDSYSRVVGREFLPKSATRNVVRTVLVNQGEGAHLYADNFEFRCHYST